MTENATIKSALTAVASKSAISDSVDVAYERRNGQSERPFETYLLRGLTYEQL